MKQAGVVFVVGFFKQRKQPAVNVFAVLQGHQGTIGLHAPVFADAQEDDAVDGLLHGEVQLPLGQIGVAQGDVAGQHFPPALDLLKEGGIHLGGAFFDFGSGDVLVKRAF